MRRTIATYFLTRIVALVVFLTTGSVCAAKGSTESSEDGKSFNPKEMVMHHIEDSYEWHITKIGDREISISLPVIVKSSTGWHCFSSKHVMHGDGKYEGLYIAKEGEYAGKIVEDLSDGTQKRPFDISITKTVTGLFINCTLLLILILCTAKQYKKREEIDYHPGGFAGVMEWFIDSLIEGIIKPCVGDNYMKFTPYLLTAFFFIFINNLMGLIPFFPGGANVTGNIAVTMVLAVATFLMVNIFGTKEYFKEIFWPDVPIFLKAIPIMPVIEFIGMFTKPFALMIRLFANIMAGHAIILSLSCLIFATVQMGAAVNASMSAVSVLFMIFMNCLELLVAFLQAYVFTMLSAFFIGLAQVEHEQE